VFNPVVEFQTASQQVSPVTKYSNYWMLFNKENRSTKSCWLTRWDWDKFCRFSFLTWQACLHVEQFDSLRPGNNVDTGAIRRHWLSARLAQYLAKSPLGQSPCRGGLQKENFSTLQWMLLDKFD